MYTHTTTFEYFKYNKIDLLSNRPTYQTKKVGLPKKKFCYYILNRYLITNLNSFHSNKGIDFCAITCDIKIIE